MDTSTTPKPALADAATQTDNTEMLVDISADIDAPAPTGAREQTVSELDSALEPPGFDPFDVMDGDTDCRIVETEDLILLELDAEDLDSVLATPQPRGV